MKPSISTQVYHAVMHDILCGVYTPNQIVTERELIEKYGCSKTTVREALVALCKEGVLHNIPRCGYQVLRIERQEIEDILQYRYILESGCIRLALDRIGPAEIRQLQQLNDACRDTAGAQDLWAHWKCNHAFHLKLVSFCGNKFAYDRLDDVMNILRRAYAQYYWDKWSRSVITVDIRYHAPLIDALERRDMRAADEALRLDLGDFGY